MPKVNNTKALGDFNKKKVKKMQKNKKNVKKH